jgi:hypothetical protein
VNREPRVHYNIVGENLDTMQKNMEAVLNASKEVGLEVNVNITL